MDVSDGNNGCGKTMTMAHIIHFCARDNWLILHAPWREYRLQLHSTCIDFGLFFFPFLLLVDCFWSFFSVVGRLFITLNYLWLLKSFQSSSIQLNPFLLILCEIWGV